MGSATGYKSIHTEMSATATYSKLKRDAREKFGYDSYNGSISTTHDLEIIEKNPTSILELQKMFSSDDFIKPETRSAQAYSFYKEKLEPVTSGKIEIIVKAEDINNSEVVSRAIAKAFNIRFNKNLRFSYENGRRNIEKVKSNTSSIDSKPVFVVKDISVKKEFNTRKEAVEYAKTLYSSEVTINKVERLLVVKNEVISYKIATDVTITKNVTKTKNHEGWFFIYTVAE